MHRQPTWRPLRKLAATVLLAAVVTPAPFVHAQPTLSAAEAADHVGETATVCGEVVSAHFAETRVGQPTFLNLDHPYPDQVFEIVIWEEHRPAFLDQLGAPPEVHYAGKYLCIRGEIGAFRGVPRTEAADPEQIRLGTPTLELASPVYGPEGDVTIDGRVLAADGTPDPHARLQWNWDDGTGQLETDLPASHRYRKNRRYSVQVTATFADGTSLTRTVPVTINNAPAGLSAAQLLGILATLAGIVGGAIPLAQFLRSRRNGGGEA